MRPLALIALLLALAPRPAAAQRVVDGVAEALRFTGYHFVSDTTVSTGNPGETYDLCIRLRRESINGIPLMTENLGYVLNATGCTAVEEFGEYFHAADDMALAPPAIAQLKAQGRIPDTVPDNAKLPLTKLVAGNIGLIAIGVFFAAGMLYAVYRMIFGERRRLRRKGASDAAAIAALAAMCHVARADGHVDGNEMKMISRWIAQLTGREFSLDHIRAMLMDDSHIVDHRDLGEGLSPGDRAMVLRCALYVAASDGQIQPSEHQVVTSMAHALGVDGLTFRSILGEVAGLLRGGGPAMA